MCDAAGPRTRVGIFQRQSNLHLFHLLPYIHHMMTPYDSSWGSRGRPALDHAELTPHSLRRWTVPTPRFAFHLTPPHLLSLSLSLSTLNLFCLSMQVPLGVVFVFHQQRDCQNSKAKKKKNHCLLRTTNLLPNYLTALAPEQLIITFIHIFSVLNKLSGSWVHTSVSCTCLPHTYFSAQITRTPLLLQSESGFSLVWN